MTVSVYCSDSILISIITAYSYINIGNHRKNISATVICWYKQIPNISVFGYRNIQKLINIS